MDFCTLLSKAQKTETFDRIAYLPGLNFDYDVFIEDHVPYYIGLTFYLFNGNLKAQKFLMNIALNIIRQIQLREDFVFEHHLSWALLMSAGNEEFSKNFEELQLMVNQRNGILDSILFCPTFKNDHQKYADSRLINVPNVTDYRIAFQSEFSHLNDSEDIREIAIKSLARDWQDELHYHIDLGVKLANFAIRLIMRR